MTKGEAQRAWKIRQKSKPSAEELKILADYNARKSPRGAKVKKRKGSSWLTGKAPADTPAVVIAAVVGEPGPLPPDAEVVTAPSIDMTTPVPVPEPKAEAEEKPEKAVQEWSIDPQAAAGMLTAFMGQMIDFCEQQGAPVFFGALGQTVGEAGGEPIILKDLFLTRVYYPACTRIMSDVIPKTGIGNRQADYGVVLLPTAIVGYKTFKLKTAIGAKEKLAAKSVSKLSVVAAPAEEAAVPKKSPINIADARTIIGGPKDAAD